MPDLERRLHRRNDRTEPLRRRRDALPRVRRCMSRRFFLLLLRTRSCAIGAEAFPISSSCFYICTFFGRAAPDRAGARPYQRSLSQDAEIRLLKCSSKTLRLLVNVLRPAWRISTRFRNVWPVGTRSRAMRGSSSDDRVGCSASDGRCVPARPALHVSTRLLPFAPRVRVGASSGIVSMDRSNIEEFPTLLMA